MGAPNQENGDINLWGYEGPPTLEQQNYVYQSIILKG